MRAFPWRRAAFTLVALTTLSGCDLFAVGQFMPGVMPGVGYPLEGTVLDGRTRLPVGGATVTSGLGTTVTDAKGHFRLYGSLSSREISVSRAGYIALTMGGQAWSPSGELQLVIDRQSQPAETMPIRHLELTGQVPGIQTGLVALGEKTEAISNGGYQIVYSGVAPGKVLTSVLAWGQISGTYRPGETAAQPYFFTTFNYMISSWALGDTVEAGRFNQPLQPGTTAVNMRPVAVKYRNAASFKTVQTDILLDFGVAGAVPVARQTGSNQEIQVPDIRGLKYVVQGTASDGPNIQSTVSITTNDPGKAAFQLLEAPRVTGPVSGAKEVGQRPTFSWQASGGAGILYELSLYEGELNAEGGGGAAQPKWVARTTDTEVTYPGFSLGDLNAGALRSDKKYTWSIRAIDLLDANEDPTTARGPVTPYRVRKRVAEARGNTFTL